MDVPPIYWSAERQRFYVLGPGPAPAWNVRQEPETRFMPADIVRLVPVTGPDGAAP